MYCIKKFSDNTYLSISINQTYKRLFFKDPESAFDYIRFDDYCSNFDYSCFGVVLCPLSYFTEDNMTELKFHFDLSSAWVMAKKSYEVGSKIKLGLKANPYKDYEDQLLFYVVE